MWVFRNEIFSISIINVSSLMWFAKSDDAGHTTTMFTSFSAIQQCHRKQ